MKALISFWNRPTHTILTRTGEMGISLIDIAEIGGLLVWGEIYDECILPQNIVEKDELLKSLITVHKFLAEIHRCQHKHKYYVSLIDWAEQFTLDTGSSSSSRAARIL